MLSRKPVVERRHLGRVLWPMRYTPSESVAAVTTWNLPTGRIRKCLTISNILKIIVILTLYLKITM